jgi:hypothetical protein
MVSGEEDDLVRLRVGTGPPGDKLLVDRSEYSLRVYKLDESL